MHALLLQFYIVRIGNEVRDPLSTTLNYDMAVIHIGRLGEAVTKRQASPHKVTGGSYHNYLLLPGSNWFVRPHHGNQIAPDS